MVVNKAVYLPLFFQLFLSFLLVKRYLWKRGLLFYEQSEFWNSPTSLLSLISHQFALAINKLRWQASYKLQCIGGGSHKVQMMCVCALQIKINVHSKSFCNVCFAPNPPRSCWWYCWWTSRASIACLWLQPLHAASSSCCCSSCWSSKRLRCPYGTRIFPWELQ